MKLGEPDADALRELFTELEFTSLLKELLPVAASRRSPLQRGEIGGRCRGGVESGARRGCAGGRSGSRARKLTSHEEQEREESETGMLPLTARKRRRLRAGVPWLFRPCREWR